MEADCSDLVADDDVKTAGTAYLPCVFHNPLSCCLCCHFEEKTDPGDGSGLSDLCDPVAARRRQQLMKEPAHVLQRLSEISQWQQCLQLMVLKPFVM